jgi:hypothetical protein
MPDRNKINILRPNGRIEKISRTEAANQRIRKLLEERRNAKPPEEKEPSTKERLLEDMKWACKAHGSRTRKKRSDAGVSRKGSARMYALRHRETLDIPGGWYSSPGRAITAFKISGSTCTLSVDDYEVVDDLQRVVRGHKKPKRPLEYGLKLPDGTIFGWYSSANRARAAYSLSLGTMDFNNLVEDVYALDVVTQGTSPAIIPGMYAVYCPSLKHFWISKKGKVWFKSARAAEAAWRYDQHNPQGWKMVTGKTADSWEVLECYVLMDQ